jgi:GAF domain-containing protein
MSAHPPIHPRRAGARRAAVGRTRAVTSTTRRVTPTDVPAPSPDPGLFARQLEVLQAASARLSRAEGTEAVGRAIVEETGRIIDYHNARVYVLEAPDLLVPIAFEGRVGEYDKVDLDLLRTRLGHGFTGWVGQHGEAILIPNANDDPRGATIPGTDDVDESMLVVPMRYDDVVVGVITLSKLGLDQFDEHDLRLLSILADQAATALESARNLARGQALAGELRLLLDVSSQLAASLDLREVANILARHLATVMGVEECAISWWDRENERVASLGYYPILPPEELEPFFDIGSFAPTRQVLEEQVAVAIDVTDPRADPAEAALLIELGHGALVMLPLVAKGRSIGLIELMSKSPIELDAERLSLARTIANEASIALENARLYEEARALADRDPLTGFYNHRYLHERFGQEAVRARRAHRPLSLLMLDLDKANGPSDHRAADRLRAQPATGWYESTIRRRTSGRGCGRAHRTVMLISERDATHRPSFDARPSGGSGDPPLLARLRDHVLRPRPDRDPPAVAGRDPERRLGGRRAGCRRRLRRRSPPDRRPGPRGGPARRGGELHQDPPGAVALDLG